MADAGLFIGWGQVVRGREDRALDVFNETIELDGDAPGLHQADVVAVKGEGVARLAWVSDSFLVGITGPEGQLGGEKGFAALSAAVEGVEQTLSAG